MNLQKTVNLNIFYSHNGTVLCTHTYQIQVQFLAKKV
jgi:hypothetical protein